jgi:alcohol dehydrogenase class IV
LSGGAPGLIARIEDLTAELGLLQRLRDVGVSRAELDRVAELTLRDGGSRRNIRPVDTADVRTILHQAW